MATATNEPSPEPKRRKATPPRRRGKIVLFGDSITQQSFSAAGFGWGAHVADRYQRRADVINRGFSGYNTDWFLRYAATDEGRADLFDHGGGAAEAEVRLATVFFGANDASDPALNERQHVPLGTYRSNLKEIVSLARSNLGRDVPVVVMSPPPVCHDGRLRYQKERYGEQATGKLERTLERSGEYAAAAGEVARELGLPFLDLWTTMQYTPNGEARWCWRDYLSDGLHLSAAGNKFVGDALIELVERLLPDLSVKPCPVTGGINSASVCEGLPRVGPWHDEIDHKQPSKAFEVEQS